MRCFIYSFHIANVDLTVPQNFVRKEEIKYAIVSAMVVPEGAGQFLSSPIVHSSSYI